jgi:hypothetical protein
MISLISEVIRNAIETKLNNNTKGQVFVVGSYAYLDDKEKHMIYNIRNGYTLIENTYIPTMITFTADFAAIPSQINGNASISVEFLLSGNEQTDLDSDLSALDEVVSKIVGNYEDLVDGSTTYHTVWNMDALMPVGVTRPLNGNYYTRIQTTIYIDFSDTNIYGNAYRYYLDGKLLALYDGSVSRTNEENYPHKQGDYEAKGGITTSQWSATLVSYLDSNLKTIHDSISSETYDMEKVYTFAEYYNGTLLHTFPVKITSMTRNILLGEKQYFTISLIKSDESAT